MLRVMDTLTWLVWLDPPSDSSFGCLCDDPDPVRSDSHGPSLVTSTSCDSSSWPCVERRCDGRRGRVGTRTVICSGSSPCSTHSHSREGLSSSLHFNKTLTSFFKSLPSSSSLLLLMAYASYNFHKEIKMETNSNLALRKIFHSTSLAPLTTFICSFHHEFGTNPPQLLTQQQPLDD
jgi:hypothetical protein